MASEFHRQESAPSIKTPEVISSGSSRIRVLFARLLIGWIVILFAEVFSGASLRPGLWNPWTLLVTYWLYFAHFFFLATLAVRTGRTSLSSLYLWGVLFGLYESWITKVVWSGYGGDGTFALGRLGPYGFSEISMAFFYHPVVSFILPLAVACLLCPSLRRWFPELAWLTGKNRGARILQIYLVITFAAVMGMNSGGPVNLALNLAVVILILVGLQRLARPALDASDGQSIVAFSRWGFFALCVYLPLLYGVSYFAIRPERLPSTGVQLFTFVFYALAVAGLRLHRRREPLGADRAPMEKRELRLAGGLFLIVLVIAFAISILGLNPVLQLFLAVNFIGWTLSGFGLAVLSLAKGAAEWRSAAPSAGSG
jgi:hypothetical protein